MSEKDRNIIINITLIGIILVFVLAFIFFPQQKETSIDSSTRTSFINYHETDPANKNDYS